MSTNARRVRRVRDRVRDYLFYIAIAFASIGMAVFVRTRFGHDAYIRWFGLVVFTTLLFGLFLKNSRELFRMRRFWEVTAVLLMVHLLVFVAILTHVEEWRLPWFTVMAFEYPVLNFFKSLT